MVSLLIGRPESMAAEGDRKGVAHRLKAVHEAMVVPAKGGDRAALGDTDLHFHEALVMQLRGRIPQ